jgi:hypothetical protein
VKLSDYSPAKRAELVAVALSIVLQDLERATPTRDVAAMVARRLETRETEIIGRLLVKWAPKIPEAIEGPGFKKYGREFRSWLWRPKGTDARGAADPANWQV